MEDSRTNTYLDIWSQFPSADRLRIPPESEGASLSLINGLRQEHDNQMHTANVAQHRALRTRTDSVRSLSPRLHSRI